MIYRFDDVEVDTAIMEIRRGGELQAAEPQVFALLRFLIEHRDRVVARDELINTIWAGRVISDAAVASCIKAARRVVGDDGGSQRMIRTVRGVGVRFVAELLDSTSVPVMRESADSLVRQAQGPDPRPPASRPSIAVLPFHLLGNPFAPMAVIADGLPHELIAAMSRLRWLLVIARGSSFHFRSAHPDVVEIGRVLSARYCLSGQVEIDGQRVAVTVELTDTRDGSVMWGERMVFPADGLAEAREKIVNRVVSTLELRIPMHEAHRVRGAPVASLDAWAAYHLGLAHMYRFNRQDNLVAQGLFERATRLDPGFARAHAGLSFTHFQTAFLRYEPDTSIARKLARASSEHALAIDPVDPFANFTYGRSFWLEGHPEDGLPWLTNAIELSPSYAQGFYAAGLIHTLAGRSSAGIEQVDLAIRLSPIDPLSYAMFATRTMAMVLAGDLAGASRFAEQAARSPGAHPLVAMIAAATFEICGDQTRAMEWAANAIQRWPGLGVEDFHSAFPFKDFSARELFTAALRALGFPG